LAGLALIRIFMINPVGVCRIEVDDDNFVSEGEKI